MPGIRSMLAVMTDDRVGAAPLQTALTIANHLSAFVEAFHVRADPSQSVPYVGEAMAGSMVGDMVTMAASEAVERAAKVQAQFERMTDAAAVSRGPIEPGRNSGIGARWREEAGIESELVALRGRIADLIIVGQPGERGEAPSLLTLNAALMESGRPVLVSPPSAPKSVGHSVVVGWNGSAEAARAVVDAMPFLVKAETVTVLLAEESEALSEPSALVEHLAWHGVEAKTRILSAGPGKKTGDALLSAADAVSADLLVMGAYTHSRLRQMILGGVTRHVLEHAKIPILFAH